MDRILGVQNNCKLRDRTARGTIDTRNERQSKREKEFGHDRDGGIEWKGQRKGMGEKVEEGERK